MEFGPITGRIISAAISVHNRLGPGLLESAYQACLAREMTRQGIGFEREWPIPVVYDGIYLECGYRADFLVENEVIVEVKAVEALNKIFEAQLLSYLKLGSKETGLLINFHELLLKNGVRRLTNRLPGVPPASPLSL